MQKPLLTIENWAVVQKTVALNYDQLQPGRHLMGKVVGHKADPGADFIYTSPIERFNTEGLVETRNTIYRLGKPSDGYTAWLQTCQMTAAAYKRPQQRD